METATILPIRLGIKDATKAIERRKPHDTGPPTYASKTFNFRRSKAIDACTDYLQENGMHEDVSHLVRGSIHDVHRLWEFYKQEETQETMGSAIAKMHHLPLYDSDRVHSEGSVADLTPINNSKESCYKTTARSSVKIHLSDIPKLHSLKALYRLPNDGVTIEHLIYIKATLSKITKEYNLHPITAFPATAEEKTA